MIIEAVLLTGGASLRMGTDKASLIVEGEPLGRRIATRLSSRVERLTVLGRAPLPGYDFLEDAQDYAGPLKALSRFRPSAEFVFLASCDLVRFEAELVDELRSLIGAHQAAVPVLDEREQPLCALYRASAFDLLVDLERAGKARLMAWVDAIDTLRVDSRQLPHGAACTNVNTRAELESI